MATSEAWLDGPVSGITPLLQPAAHALVQARNDISANVPGVSPEVLWTRKNGAASAGFHLLHMAGALDRLFTYARAESLTDDQKAAARAESQDRPDMDGAALVAFVSSQIDKALNQLRSTDGGTLLDERKIGRAGLPSTVIGCLFHGAEHTARHAGQCVSTIKILAGS
jgi:hypothetical protein